MIPATTPSLAKSVMDHLRDSTAEAHKRAESSPLMRSIARGTITRERYLAHLEQLLRVHQALEGELDRAAARRPQWAGLALAERPRVPDLTADLTALGGNLFPSALPATGKAVVAIRRASPLALLGMFYVTEGSTNGGRFLVKMVAKALELDPASDRGLRAQNPYGDAQPARWAEFKAAMNALPFTAAEIAELESGAKAMFDLLARIAEEIQPA